MGALVTLAFVKAYVFGSCVGIDREAVWVDISNDTNRPKPTDR